MVVLENPAQFDQAMDKNKQCIGTRCVDEDFLVIKSLIKNTKDLSFFADLSSFTLRAPRSGSWRTRSRWKCARWRPAAVRIS